MVHYRAIRSNYGFRGRLWEKGEIARDVTEDEKIPEHFEQLAPGAIPEEPRDESFDASEPETLSDWQQREHQTEPAPGLEDRKKKPTQEKPKPKRK